MRHVHIVRSTAGVAGAVAVAELVSRAGLVDPDSLPPTSVVLWRAAELVVNTEFLTDVANTLKAWFGGLLLATVVAVAAGVVLSSTPRLNRATRIVAEFMRPIPSVALIPLAIVTFSSPTETKMSLVFYAAAGPSSSTR